MPVLAILGNGLAVAGNKEKSDSSTTHAAVSDGTIIINDSAKQQQNVDDLSRDVAHANQTLSPIFDKEKEQQRMQTLQIIGEIGNQAADIARTQGEIAGLKAQSDPAALDAARAELMVHGNSHPTSEQVAKQAYQNAKATFGTGSAIQQAITASTAAIQGLAGGDIAKALAGASAPYLAEVIHRQTTSADGEVNIPANLMAHAVVNAALSLAKGENALAGASSAVTAEAVGLISEAYYDKKPTELKEDEKQTVSALASLAAGLAGGLVGGDTASAVSGMQTGKVTVENNLMGGTEDGQEKFVREHGKNIASCADNPGSASCQKGLAMQDALMVALPAGMGGGILAAATPEIAASAKAAIQACAGNVVLCLNNAGIQLSEALVPGGVGAGGAVGIGKTAAEATAAKAEVVAANAAKPNWLQNVQAGNKFNSEQAKNYPYNELYINKPGGGYYRVDSYNPSTGEIVSRKFTQFSDITETTANNYIREAVKKYPAGATIADVPSSGKLAGGQLEGINILEVPPQVRPIPKQVLDAADKAGVTIRDTNGKIY
ncbi:VENN motif pre-toxin domain-containing protein [Rosenbergiella epipactidis]|uniref:VENN motif pre-toxin domain-containing protein n=1 Tax=Rosenbergiella epipactidis TaxID=1544694 RepID=UPI003D6BF7E9